MVLHLSKVLSSLIGGHLSDVIGRRILIVSGWIVYALVYAGFQTYGSVLNGPFVFDDSYLPFRVLPLDVAIVVLAAIAVCFGATLYPSRQAGRLDPAEQAGLGQGTQDVVDRLVRDVSSASAHAADH